MIVAEQKSLAEMKRMIAPYERVLIVGCGTCMTVCCAPVASVRFPLSITHYAWHRQRTEMEVIPFRNTI